MSNNNEKENLILILCISLLVVPHPFYGLEELKKLINTIIDFIINEQ